LFSISYIMGKLMIENMQKFFKLFHVRIIDFAIWKHDIHFYLLPI